MTGGDFIGWTIQSLLASALLMLAILLLRAQVRRVAGVQVAYALWALPVLRLVLPPLPHWPAAIVAPVSQAGQAIVILVAPATAPTLAAAPHATFPTALLVLGLWAVGALAFLGWHVANHRHFCRQIVAGATSVDYVDGIRIIESATAPGPIAFGIVDRYVAFPIDIADRYDADERALALAHELGHHARGDLIANWIALVVLAIHWFDPIAWRAFRAFRADQELANDARVLAGRSAADRHIYACAIVKAAHGGAVSAACHLHTITDLKGRLKMLTTTPASRRRFALGATTVGAIVIAGLGLTASGSSAAAISAGMQEAVAPAAPPVPPVPAIPAPRTIETTNSMVNHTRNAFINRSNGNEVSNVTVTENGKTMVYSSAGVDAHIADGDRIAILPPAPGGTRMIVKSDSDPNMRVELQNIPAISSATCGIGTGRPISMVIDSGKGAKRKIVVCTDRIEKVTVDAMVTARNSKATERDAYIQGLAGLIQARATVVADTSMSDADRARSLNGIDQSIAEMKGQLSGIN